MLLLGQKTITGMEDLQAALSYNLDNVDDCEYAVAKLAAKMAVTVKADWTEIDMVKLWNAAHSSATSMVGLECNSSCPVCLWVHQPLLSVSCGQSYTVGCQLSRILLAYTAHVNCWSSTCPPVTASSTAYQSLAAIPLSYAPI